MNKQYRYVATTIKNNHVMIRDYNLNDCYKGGYDLLIVYKNREMLVPHSQLKIRAIKLDNRTYPSKYNRPYKVYHLRWKAIDNLEEEIKNKQQKLL